MAATVERYLADAERVGTAGDPQWLVRARREGLERFQALGFPTTRDEEWRFTSVAPIAEAGFEPASAGVPSLDKTLLTPFAVPGPLAATLVFVNGRYLPSASAVGPLAQDVRIVNLGAALADPAAGLEAYCTRIAAGDDRAFTALNTAFLADGAFVQVPDRTLLEAPIHLVFLSAGEGHPTMALPRVLLLLGESSQASIVESYGTIGGERCFTNAITEAVVGQNAHLYHYKIDRDVPEGYHVGGMYVRASRDAQVTCQSIALGTGSIVRNDVVVVLDGEGAMCTLNGLYVGDGSRLVDNHTTIDHARPHCASREVYKGILGGQARAVFNGKIIVRPDAQKTDAKQTNKALLLSDDAQINTKPQLEIFANDVKCTHGAAIGQMDEDAVFYLRARGLSEAQARHMLIRAFAGDVLAAMPFEPLRTQLEAELTARLPEGGR
jgi:Fe-S cluster assembly protein SufD